jgi:predicted  nucleic acid-binding Zn-ribbon protein
MLTDQDIKKLEAIIDHKLDPLQRNVSILITGQNELKKEVVALRETVQGLAVAVDSLAKAIDDLRLEYAAIKNQLARHEEWIKKIAEKAGVKLEY